MEKSDILQHYREHREEIQERLGDFRKLRDASEERKFLELVFVILTSRTSAEKSWDAAQELENNKLLETGSSEEISEVLGRHDIQYPEEKADYIVENREDLSQPTLSEPSKKLKMNSRIDDEDLEWTRRWLAQNVKGISWKGASHFLRNIGYGNSFAIISGHISSQMYELGLKEDPDPVTDGEEYRKLEEQLKEFSEELGVDVKALDLVLWSMKTGKIFK